MLGRNRSKPPTPRGLVALSPSLSLLRPPHVKPARSCGGARGGSPRPWDKGMRPRTGERRSMMPG
eukprot:750657-Pyramimonas_sp.AAC.1